MSETFEPGKMEITRTLEVPGDQPQEVIDKLRRAFTDEDEIARHIRALKVISWYRFREFVQFVAARSASDSPLLRREEFTQIRDQ